MREKQKKMNKEINLKGKKGITLIALVITIIVLLILAGVTIATLTGDNGLLQKAANAKEKTTDAEICEQIKLAYAEYQIGQYSTEVDIEKSLKKIFGNENVSNVSIKKDKLIATINRKTFKYNANTGIAEEFKDPFNYGTKDRESLEEGDIITLGTERFKVFSVTDNEIKAMSFYNLLLSLNPIKQATDETKNLTESRAFASDIYWTADEEMQMDNSKNIIQKYIKDYKKTLENMGADDITVRIPRCSDFSYKKGEQQIEVPASLKNPGGYGTYWIGNCTWDINRIRTSYGDGTIYSYRYDDELNVGIRAIIVIPLI